MFTLVCGVAVVTKERNSPRDVLKPLDALGFVGMESLGDDVCGFAQNVHRDDGNRKLPAPNLPICRGR